MVNSSANLWAPVDHPMTLIQIISLSRIYTTSLIDQWQSMTCAINIYLKNCLRVVKALRNMKRQEKDEMLIKKCI